VQILFVAGSHERGIIGHNFGDGVLQFIIRPNDLRERRFDKVELIASSC
jgi:hypothetical protein